MSKLRMIQRKQVLTFTPVYDLHAKVLLGYLGDLTLKGGLMVSEKPMEIDVSTEIPSTHITLPARVAWCNLEEHRTYYNTGLEFLVVSDEDTKVIEAVLENYQFNHEMPR
jgi:hypothetical protein